jgi:hypothetical protein
MLCNWNINSLTLSYRAPTGDSELFHKKLENINYLYKPKPEFIMCGAKNSDYLIEKAE